MPGALEYYLDMLKKIQKQVHCAIGPTFPLALKKIILMWSALASSIGTLLEYTQSLSLKYGRTFLPKNLSMGGTNHLGKLIGGCSTWGD